MQRVRMMRVIRAGAWAFAFFAAILTTLFSKDTPVLFLMASLLYTGLLIGWTLSVRHRIYLPDTRAFLCAAALACAMLFVLRLMRSLYFSFDARLSRILLLSQLSVGCIAVLLFLLAAVSLFSDRKKKSLFLVISCIITFLCLVWILTDPVHHLLFFTVSSAGPGPLGRALFWLFVFVSFTMLLMLLSFKSKRSTRFVFGLPCVLILFVFLCFLAMLSCGAVTANDLVLYHPQEAFSFLFVALFEGAIRTGLVPGNSGYEELFLLSHTSGLIQDTDGRIIYRSRGWTDTQEDRDHQIGTVPIRGGTLSFIQDRTAINALNDEIREATEQIENENDLVQEERRVHEERLEYEMKNRLYDRVAYSVRPQVLQISDKLDACSEDPGATADAMRDITILGAYVKRRGNLLLTADERDRMPLEELTLCLRESFEYLSLRGVFTDLQSQESGRLLPSALILEAYDLFETVIEGSLGDLAACTAELKAEPFFQMHLQTASGICPIDQNWHKEHLDSCSARLIIHYEDETASILLEEKEAEHA